MGASTDGSTTDSCCTSGAVVVLSLDVISGGVTGVVVDVLLGLWVNVVVP